MVFYFYQYSLVYNDYFCYGFFDQFVYLEYFLIFVIYYMIVNGLFVLYKCFGFVIEIWQVVLEVIYWLGLGVVVGEV